jgi:predicted RNase H-like HicB family nuclease
VKYVYPVIFTKVPTGYEIAVPDLPGCFTDGTSLADAIDMARDAIAMWLCDAENKNEPIPEPSAPESLEHDENSFVNLVDADTDAYRRENDNRAVKKNLSIPSWLNAQAERAGISFSAVLQEGLKKKLGVK